MKTTILAFTLLGALAAAPALAQDRTEPMTMTSVEAPTSSSGKTFGVGYGQTPGGVRGVEIEYYLGSRLMLNGHLGFAFFSPDGDADSVNAFALAAGLFYRWRVWEDNVALMLGGRLDIGHASGSGSGDADATQFNVEVPLRTQIYFAEILAVHAEIGAVLAIIDDGGGILGSYRGASEGVYLDLPSVNLLASFGVTVYFD